MIRVKVISSTTRHAAGAHHSAASQHALRPFKEGDVRLILAQFPAKAHYHCPVIMYY